MKAKPKTPETESASAGPEQTALVALPTAKFLPQIPDFTEDMVQEMEGIQVTFDRIRIPAGGSMAWEIPSDDPQKPEIVPDFLAVILDHYPVNAYWAGAYQGQRNPPDCSALDGRMGQGKPGGPCMRCALNQWKSAEDGRGKACKNMHRLYCIRNMVGDVPKLVTLPPTSVRPFSDWLAKRAILRGKRSYELIVRIGLARAQNVAGIAYSQATFTTASILERESAELARQFKRAIESITRQQKITAEDYVTEPEASTAPEEEDVV